MQILLSFGFRQRRDSISWLHSCDKSSYIRSVCSQCHVDSLAGTEQKVNNQTLTQVSQLYVHVSFSLKVISSWLNLPTSGHRHVICMCEDRQYPNFNILIMLTGGLHSWESISFIYQTLKFFMKIPIPRYQPKTYLSISW